MNGQDGAAPAADRSFSRKVLRAQWALVFEQLWLRLWVLLAVGALFVAVSYAGLWAYLPDIVHMGLLGLFAAAGLFAVIHMLRVPWPSREEAIRRIERESQIPHRPASSYEDTLTASASDPATRTLWTAHRQRMAALLSRLKAGNPHPRTDRFDPYATRALALLLLMLLTALAGGTALERLQGAFRLSSTARLAETRLDAWITPPAYTQRPPLMLADGATPIGKREARQDPAKSREVPEKSVLIVRAAGMGSTKLALEIAAGDGAKSGDKPQRIEPEAKTDSGDVQEVRFELKRSSTMRVLAGTAELASWHVVVIPDNAPAISLSKPPELTPRGSMKLTYKVSDDYGVASAAAKLEKAKPAPSDPKKAWAGPQPLKGPRPPLMRPPTLTLRVPPANAREGEMHTYLELGSHPWAGLKVLMTLEAKDVAGQTGRSPGIEMILPGRRFTKPLANAVVEQRRKLLDDPRYREQVQKALDALTLEPDGFIEDMRVYLGLRTVYHRLGTDRTRAGMKSNVDQLWHIALRIEDGSLSDAERALREAQDKLAKALEDGASDEEIKRLMQELKQALNDYMKQLAEQSAQDGQPQEGQDEQNQVLGQEDLEQMMRNLEEMAQSGAREQAQQLLSEMRDLMERMQSGRVDEQQAQKNKEMMEMMDQLGDMVGEQQQLMDDTFEERRNEGQGDQGEGQKPPPGMKGMGQDPSREGQGGGPPGMNQQAQRGKGQKRGQGGQQAQQGQGDQLGQGQQGQRGLDGLRQRQKELRERLAQLQKQMREKGAGAGQQLDSASEAMEGAEQALERGDLETANEEQARALDQMRQGAQSMAQEMLRNMPQRYGQSGDTPRDPLGRPQRSQGPDLGTSVKVPDEIDIQRAREILEELRRRLGDATRGAGELDYLERLLRRF